MKLKFPLGIRPPQPSECLKGDADIEWIDMNRENAKIIPGYKIQYPVKDVKNSLPILKLI